MFSVFSSVNFLSHVHVFHPGDLELHLRHSADWNSVASSRKKKKFLLHGEWHCHDNIPEISAKDDS